MTLLLKLYFILIIETDIPYVNLAKINMIKKIEFLTTNIFKANNRKLNESNFPPL